LSFFLTLLVAALGAFVFLKLKVPAGAFLGSMVFVALFNVLAGAAFFPEAGRPLVRVFAGALIGARMKREDVIQMKDIIVPSILIVLGMLALNLALGYGIFRLTGLELTTALLGSAPGGVQDMALIAQDMDADTAQVAVLHTIRILAILGLHPTLLSLYCKRYLRLNPGQDKRRRAVPAPGSVERSAEQSAEQSGRKEGLAEQSAEQSAEERAAEQSAHKEGFEEQSAHKEQSTEQSGRKEGFEAQPRLTPEPEPLAPPPAQPRGNRLARFLGKEALPYARTMLFAGIGGFLLNLTSIPAGAMAGATMAVVLATLFVRPSYSPPKMRPVIMACSGALIGSGIGTEDLVRLMEIIVPAIILVLVLLVANFVFGILVHKFTKLDLVTALYASAAGGITDMALISDEMGADSPKVAVIHILRLICVVTLFPTILKFFSSLV